MKKQQGDFFFTRQEEDKARRVARRNGLRVSKSRDLLYHSNNRGGLRLIDPYNNTVVAGLNFDCTPEQIIYFAEKHSQ